MVAKHRALVSGWAKTKRREYHHKKKPRIQEGNWVSAIGMGESRTKWSERYIGRRRKSLDLKGLSRAQTGITRVFAEHRNLSSQ